MALDVGLLNLVATWLIVLVASRVAFDRMGLDLRVFAVYATAGMAAAMTFSLLRAQDAEVAVLYFGFAVVLGVYWAAFSRKVPAPSGRLHALSAVAAVVLVLVIFLVARSYAWWVAPLLLLALMAVGIVVNGVIPMLQEMFGRGDPPTDDGTPPGAAPTRPPVSPQRRSAAPRKASRGPPPRKQAPRKPPSRAPTRPPGGPPSGPPKRPPTPPSQPSGPRKKAP